MSSSYIHTADPAAPAASSAPLVQLQDNIPDVDMTGAQTIGHAQNFQSTASSVANAASFVQNNSAPHIKTQYQYDNPASMSNIQEILKRAREGTNFSAGSAEWEAAREKVLKSMASSTHPIPTPPSIRGRGRGRGAVGPTISLGSEISSIGDISSADGTTPTKRGRGRGRPRGSRGSGRGRGKGGKRKRGSDESEGSPSEDGSDVSDSYTPLTTMTKSGRSVTKPSQFNPAPEIETDGEPKRRKQYRKGPESALCAKCQRGHSPQSNAIVFCDGCNFAYHQWCHDPHIPKEVIEVADKEWFCGKCQYRRETESLPMANRVAGGDLTTVEQKAYLSTLSSKTLVELLLRATEMHHNIPIFAPNTKDLIKQKHSPSFSATPASTTTQHTTHPTEPHQSLTTYTHEAEPEDPYPDFSNPNDDPPASYPRPGTGPIKIRPTTHVDDIPWLLDDNYEVFSHLVDDGTGTLVPVDRSTNSWIGEKKEPDESGFAAPERNGGHVSVSGGVPGQAGAAELAMAQETDGMAADIYHGFS